MSTIELPTKSLILTLCTRDETLALIDAMAPADRAQVSPDWLAALRASGENDPWRQAFSMIHRETGESVGSCAFKGSRSDGFIEIAYGVDPAHQCKGYATEAAEALTNFAFAEGLPTVRAHTLPTNSPSIRVLTKCGFQNLGEVIEPDDGLVWRWERHQTK